MLFIVDKESGKRPPSNPGPDKSYPVVVLKKDGWNDYSYHTTCNVYVFMSYESSPEEIGSVRIMYRKQKTGIWVFEQKPSSFSSLDKNFCSLSSNMAFYDNLKALGIGFSARFLKAVRDAAYSPDIWKSFDEDECFQVSLLRDKSLAIKVRDAVPQLFGGRSRSIKSFSYTVKLPGAENELKVFFDFRDSKGMSRNIMLLVGPNGAGKTQFLSRLAIALSGITTEEGTNEHDEVIIGKRMKAGRVNPTPSFYGVVAISFNAFDKFELPKPKPNAIFSYTYCGIRTTDENLCTENDLIQRIRESVERLDDNQRKILSATIKNVLGVNLGEDLNDADANYYTRLSAGQRIVLNILTHLISNLQERTLVLIDEPETHLHPSLMTSLISEISKLLATYKSYAIIATHSPIIAQQVSSSSIRVMARFDGSVEVTIPNIECFGENLSEISNALFEAREFKRDYTSIIDKLLEKYDYKTKRVEALFPGGLGSNAQVYLWSAARRRKK